MTIAYEQYFPVLLLVMLNKVVVIKKSVLKSLVKFEQYDADSNALQRCNFYM